MFTTLSNKDAPPTTSATHLRLSSLSSGRQSSKNSKKVSVLIDKGLTNEAARRKDASKREVKVVLLGQAESGKSTLQKQFQLSFAPESLDAERLAWVIAVYLNIAKALRTIFVELYYQLNHLGPNDPFATDEIREDVDTLRFRLLPLMVLEGLLAAELNEGMKVTGRPSFLHSVWQSSDKSDANKHTSRTSELAHLGARTLANVADDIKILWAHAMTRFYIEKRKIPLNDSASHFFNDIQRIAEPDYCPTNADILHARIQTPGVVEYILPVTLSGRSYTWTLYDVAGARSQRHAWAPFLDDATAIIFMGTSAFISLSVQNLMELQAPISAFDQYLEENPSVNRLEDSLQFWSEICSNKLLKNSRLVLFLNKVDLLKEKLKAGISVLKYISSFGDRPNEYQTVADYFRAHFVQAYRRNSAANRRLYIHLTSVLVGGINSSFATNQFNQ